MVTGSDPPLVRHGGHIADGIDDHPAEQFTPVGVSRTDDLFGPAHHEPDPS